MEERNHIYDLKATDGRVLLSLHIKNDMINATRLCQSFSKQYGNFRHTHSYRVIMNQLLANFTRNDIERISKRTGSWISPLLLDCLCEYLSDDVAWKADVKNNLLKKGIKGDTQLQRINVLSQQVAQLEKQIQDMKYDTEIEVTRATFDIECENERHVKENEELKRQCQEAQKKYDKEISYKHHWNKYINEYKTVYEYARDMYRIDMTEATYKKVDKMVAKQQKARYAQAAIHHNLYTQLEKYSLLVSAVRPLNPEMLRPPEPRQPSHFKKITPRVMHTYHKRDWDLIDGLLDMYKDDPAYL